MFENIRQRNTDLMQAIRTAKRRLSAGAGGGMTTMDVMRLAVTLPAPGYYVAFDTALRATGEVLRGKRATGSELRQRQWEEIAAKVRREMERGNLRLTEAVARVITTGGASRFFISPTRALSIYHEEMRHRFR